MVKRQALNSGIFGLEGQKEEYALVYENVAIAYCGLFAILIYYRMSLLSFIHFDFSLSTMYISI